MIVLEEFKSCNCIICGETSLLFPVKSKFICIRCLKLTGRIKLAKIIGVPCSALSNYLKVTKVIPELQMALANNRLLKYTVISAVFSTLVDYEQKDFLKFIGINNLAHFKRRELEAKKNDWQKNKVVTELPPNITVPTMAMQEFNTPSLNLIDCDDRKLLDNLEQIYKVKRTSFLTDRDNNIFEILLNITDSETGTFSLSYSKIASHLAECNERNARTSIKRLIGGGYIEKQHDITMYRNTYKILKLTDGTPFKTILPESGNPKRDIHITNLAAKNVDINKNLFTKRKLADVLMNVGTVVSVYIDKNDAIEKKLIIGKRTIYEAIVDDHATRTVYDYIGVNYPSGYKFGISEFFYFNHDDIYDDSELMEDGAV